METEKTYRIEKCDSKVQWDEFILENNGHPLQLWGWGDLKTIYNWRAERFFIVENEENIGAVQLLIRKLPKPFGQLLYVPRGPVVVNGHSEAVYTELVEYVRETHKGIALTVEPDSFEEPTGESWRESDNHVLQPATIRLDLSKPEGVLLGNMSKKTRQYIRKSGSTTGLEVRKIGNPEDVSACLELYRQTAGRAGFNLHKDQYYIDLNDKLGEFSVIFGCYEGDELVSFLWLAVSESVAFELYGGVSARGQELRANYILKWEAIRRTRQWGIACYDMNGLINDGISNFKRGFASHEDRLIGTFDIPMSPLYSLWTKVLPGGKKFLQRIRKKR